ncbi:hypothetical protein TrispH2_010922 [Trichoplax sp. H2]|nr:hypothetical protein TrispH2_010922 [Trichoplax sp. H2]|eukprot:RDD36860.1 hypothetical protein TrispH2_010922 [Trichoplax sp. H2]
MKSQSIIPNVLSINSSSSKIAQEKIHLQEISNNAQQTEPETDKKFLRQQISRGWNIQRYNLLPDIREQGRGRALSDVSLLLRHTLNNSHSTLSSNIFEDSGESFNRNYSNRSKTFSRSDDKSLLSLQNSNRTDQTLTTLTVPTISINLKEKKALPPINLEGSDNRPRFMTVLGSAPPPAAVLTMSASEIIPCTEDPRDTEEFL